MSIRDPPKKKSVCRSRQGHGIWEKEGRPDRKDLDHWFRAEAVIRACQRTMELPTCSRWPRPAGARRLHDFEELAVSCA